MTTVTIIEFLNIRPLPVTDKGREACTFADRERLDPIVGGEPTRAELAVRTVAAHELCAVCPVAQLCAAEGDRYAEVGVWGGALRYRAGGPHGTYTVIPLVPQAVPSIWEGEVR